MTVHGISGMVQAAIQRASQATGVDFSFLMKTANRESGFNPSAKSGTSSAAGLFQFVGQTWLSTLKQHGAKHGYASYADLIEKGADGRYHVPGGDTARQEVMNLRLDPHAASLMAGELTSDAAAYLKGRTGRAATAGELYAAHFLGPQGSARLIDAAQRQPGAAAADLFPEAAHANKTIFYKDGRAATVGEVYANLTRAAGAAVAPVAEPAASPDSGYIQFVSDQTLSRQAQQAEMISLILRGSQASEGAGVGSRVAGSMFTTEMLRVLADSRKS